MTARKLMMFNRAAQVRAGAINGLGAIDASKFSFNLTDSTGETPSVPSSAPSANMQLDYGANPVTGKPFDPWAQEGGSKFGLPELKLDLSWADDLFRAAPISIETQSKAQARGSSSPALNIPTGVGIAIGAAVVLGVTLWVLR